MKISPRVLLITAVISIVLIILSVIIQRNAINAQPTMTVYKAADNITAGSTITKHDLTATTIYWNQEIPSYIKNLNDAVGKMAKENIYKDEIVSGNRLIDNNNSQNIISDDKQRFSIPASCIDDPYSLTLRKGDMVDIIYTNAASAQGSAKTNIKSEVVVPHVLVVGALNKEGKLITNGEVNANAIIFDATQVDILKLTQCQYQGKFRFVKYSDKEKTEILSSSSSVSDMNSQIVSSANTTNTSQASSDDSQSVSSDSNVIIIKPKGNSDNSPQTTSSK